MSGKSFLGKALFKSVSSVVLVLVLLFSSSFAYVESFDVLSYDPEVNYLSLIRECVLVGDEHSILAARVYEEARNLKIRELDLPYYESDLFRGIFSQEELLRRLDSFASDKYQYRLIPLTNEQQDFVFELSNRYYIDPDVIFAIMWTESTFRTSVVSKGNSGIMQINHCNRGWLREELGVEDLLDFKQNTLAGTYIIAGYFAKYSPHKALMVYNCGEAGARSLWSEGFSTSGYSRKVLLRAENLKSNYTPWYEDGTYNPYYTEE